MGAGGAAALGLWRGISGLPPLRKSIHGSRSRVYWSTTCGGERRKNILPRARDDCIRDRFHPGSVYKDSGFKNYGVSKEREPKRKRA